MEFWRDVFERVSRSDFLTGVSGSWKANYDWIIKPANLQKILEGSYENRTGGRRDLWGKGGAGNTIGTDSGMKSRADAPFMQGSAQEATAAPVAAKPVGASRIDMAAPFMRTAAAPAAEPAAPVVTKPVEAVEPAPKRLPFTFATAQGVRK
jgi:hypothetical protein